MGDKTKTKKIKKKEKAKFAAGDGYFGLGFEQDEIQGYFRARSKFLGVFLDVREGFPSC